MTWTPRTHFFSFLYLDEYIFLLYFTQIQLIYTIWDREGRENFQLKINVFYVQAEFKKTKTQKLINENEIKRNKKPHNNCLEN